jgi:hypothetical protein
MAAVSIASKNDLILAVDLAAGQVGVITNDVYAGRVVMGFAPNQLGMRFVCLESGHFWSADADHITVRLLGTNEVVTLKNYPE